MHRAVLHVIVTPLDTQQVVRAEAIELIFNDASGLIEQNARRRVLRRQGGGRGGNEQQNREGVKPGG